jgi:hypothetical protein
MGLISWLKNFLSFDQAPHNPLSKEAGKTQMNEGDFHSGPGGYSPNTGYPDTFYGSGGSNEHGHNEGDFNR